VSGTDAFPLITMSALLMVLSLLVVFLLYRHLKTLQNEQKRLQHLLDGTPAAMFWYDLSGRVAGCNVAFERLTGYTLSDLKGQEWSARLLPDETALQLRHSLQNSTENPLRFSAVLIKADGAWLPAVLEIQHEKNMGIVNVRGRG